MHKKMTACFVVLLTTALSACGASPTSTGVGLPSESGGAEAVPAVLQGEWRSGRTSPISYYDPASGACPGASGTSFMLTLGADGDSQFTGLMVVPTGGGESKILSVESGTVALTDTRLDLIPSVGSVQYYICDPRNVKQGSLHPWHFSWQLSADDSGQDELLLGDADGQARPDAFYRPN